MLEPADPVGLWLLGPVRACVHPLCKSTCIMDVGPGALEGGSRPHLSWRCSAARSASVSARQGAEVSTVPLLGSRLSAD